MPVQVSYPGVYIDEFTPGAPIEGVGTSTAAFIGIAERGDISIPSKITTFDRFLDLYGDQPVPGFYLWYAARGFFENGGQTCYIVRASNGTYARWTLNDRTTAPGRPIVRLRARQPGVLGLTINVADAPLMQNVAIYRPRGTLAQAANQGAREVTLGADGTVTPVNVAGRFRPGDEVTFSGGNDRLRITSIAGPVVRLSGAVSQNYPATTTVMRLANTSVGTQTIRLRPPAALPAGQLVPGTIVSVAQGTNSDTQIVESVLTEVLTEGTQGVLGPVSYRVTFRSGLAIQLDLDPAGANAPTAQSREIDLTLTLGTVNIPYGRLSMDSAHPRYLVDVLNADLSGLLTAELIEPPPANAPPPNSVLTSLPRAGAAVVVNAGTAENLAALSGQDFSNAIDALRPIDDVNIISVPDRPTAPGQTLLPVQQALISHCENMGDRFAILDATDPAQELFPSPNGSVSEQRPGLDSARGYGALYYPWLRVSPAGTGGPILVPPSGHVCGIIARSDNMRGVHKAPANEIVRGAVGVARTMSDIDHGQLNLIGINVIRLFQGGGRPVLYGARTTATDRSWQYVNIRRLFLFLEESIQEGIRWAVFEPNNLALWQKLRRTITDFLLRVWRDGGLFGKNSEDAFYVRIDETLNPFSEQALGRLHIEIGVRPSYPAEFVIVRIGIWPGGSEITEA